MSIAPSSESVEEGGIVTITCIANVGRPRGSVRWKTLVGTIEEDVSSNVGLLTSDWLQKIM